jgi:predicted aspartyl protease
MIVDTGASVVKINVGLLKKLNQPPSATFRKGKALTAAGVVDAHEVFLGKIDLGGAVKRNVRAGFSHEAHDNPYCDGLLGLSFLSDFRMTIDYEKNVIHLQR